MERWRGRLLGKGLEAVAVLWWQWKTVYERRQRRAGRRLCRRPRGSGLWRGLRGRDDVGRYVWRGRECVRG